MCFYRSISLFNTPKSHIDMENLCIDVDQASLTNY